MVYTAKSGNDLRQRLQPQAAGGFMRVLHCYSGNLYGGIESLLATLARQRDLAAGMIPEFALCFEGRLDEELRAAGVVVHQMGAVRFRRPWSVLQARHRLAQVLKVCPPDVVVCHACWPHVLFGPVARRAGCPLVFWMHDFAGGGHWAEALGAWTVPDLVVVNSQVTAATLPRLFPKAPHEVLYYPVAPPPAVERPQVRARVRCELSTPAEAVVILQASRLETWKGQSLLIEALGRLREQPGWVAWLAGGAQRPHEQVYLERLQAEARAAGIADRVRFLGQRSDVPDLLAAADIHCQPNTGPEPFGIAFIEALYAGLPVVSTRLGGAAEIVTEACGVLVPPADSSALASALGALIADPETRARLGSAGPERARFLCDPAAALGRFQELLSQVITTPKQKPGVVPSQPAQVKSYGHLPDRDDNR
jgi:glycosyltransferase involved in cell wall biosynthesis